jgi:hypothetical protein
MSTSDPCGYIPYSEVVSRSLPQAPADWEFKSHPQYRPMLEHVEHDLGEKYLKLIKAEFSEVYTTNKKLLQSLCGENDSYGKPSWSPEGSARTNFGVYSPTNMRYIYQAFLILQYIKSNKINNINFIEIGGGYGGLALFVHRLSPLFKVEVSSYTLFDLPAPAELQQRYLTLFDINANIGDVDNPRSLYDNSFLISNYAFSEISGDYQKEYLQKIIIPYVSHGFLTWNCIPFYDITKDSEIAQVDSVSAEKPLTAPSNLQVYIKAKVE